jgi:hypothetical protein
MAAWSITVLAWLCGSEAVAITHELLRQAWAG